MKTSPPRGCPFAADRPGAAPPHPPGVWPPGPPNGLTGWRHLPRMARDLLGTLAAWQREYGDAVHVRIWPEHEVLVADPHLARELLVTHHDALVRWERGIRVFRQLQGHSVLTAEGEAWRGKRQALQPAFAPRSVQAFVPTIAGAVAAALQDWPDRAASWNIEGALTSLAMDVIVRMMFSSVLGEDARAAERAVHEVLAIADAEFYRPASWPAWMPWMRRKREALATLDDFIQRHVRERLAAPGDAWPDDLLSRLLRLHLADPAAWPLRAVRDECMTIFLAGHETAAATLAWWAWCMASHPQAQDTARAEVRRILQGRPPAPGDLAELRYLAQTLQETLRLHPAVPVLFTRRARRPVALSRWQFPARTLFMLPVQLLHHDARWFPEPLAFRPERFAPGAEEIPRGAYLPFGAGPRVCLGQHLALTEMTVAAAMLLQRFVLSVPEGGGAPRARLHVTLRPEPPLQLRLAPAHSWNT